MLLVYILFSIAAGIMVARDASNATLMLMAVLAALAAPVNDIAMLPLIFKFSIPSLLIGMITAVLYERTFGQARTPRDT